MKKTCIAVITSVLFLAGTAVAHAVDTSIRTLEAKTKECAAKVQVETTKECYCVDKYGKRTGQKCVYIKGASLKNGSMKQ